MRRHGMIVSDVLLVSVSVRFVWFCIVEVKVILAYNTYGTVLFLLFHLPWGLIKACVMALHCTNHALLSLFVAIKDLIHVGVNIDKVDRWPNRIGPFSFLVFLWRIETWLT